MKRPIGLCLCLLAVVYLRAEPVLFLTQPSLSPDSQRVAFCFMGDLWQVEAQGGSAMRLTAMPGDETSPRFSPDGHWLAFSGTAEGNRNVYLLPLGGGEIRQLTVHSAQDTVSSWSWDSRTVYFTSDRENAFNTYAVSIDGGTPRPLFTGYFTNLASLIESPDGRGYYFIDSMEGQNFPQRKRYKGALNPEILYIERSGKGLKTLAAYEGKDMWPMADRAGHVYFASDRQTGEYNLFTLEGDLAVELTSFDRSIRDPQVSADGGKLVFEKDYQLYLFDVASRQTAPLAVQIPHLSLLDLPSEFKLDGEISAFAASADAKKLALVSRGLLFVSDAKGAFVRQLASNPLERVKEVYFGQDDQTVIFSQTVKGWLNWFVIPSNGSKPARAITNDQQSNRSLTLAPDGKQAVYLSGRNELRLLDMTTFVSKTLLRDEFWAFRGSPPVFSPDGRYLAFAAYRQFEQDVLIHDLRENKTINMTDSGLSEGTPLWSADGRYLYLSADRLQPTFPRGGKRMKVYRLALQRFAEPFRSVKANELFAQIKPKDKPDKKGEEIVKATPVAPVNIEWPGLEDRWQRVGVQEGNQNLLALWQDKDKQYILYTSDQQGQQELWVTIEEPFMPPKHLQIKDVGNLGFDGLELYCRSEGSFVLVGKRLLSLDLKAQKASPIELKHHFTKSMADEFSQMFYETWANMDENFYDDAFHGLDWQKMGDYYSRFLPQLRSREDLRRLLNDMLGELNASHLGFRSQGDEEKTRHQMVTSETGILFAADDPYRVIGVLPRSAADRQKVDVQPGDRLLRVNGVAVDAKANRHCYFTSPRLMEEMELGLSRPGKERLVRIHPESLNDTLDQWYTEWEERCQAQVDGWSDKRISYIHMRDMGEESLERFLTEMGSEWYRRDALILDLRHNRGGNVHDAVLNYLAQRPYSSWKYRGGKMAPQPNFAPAAKPIVMLVNEQSLSDAEVTSAGFKALGLGPVIGTETYRWIIFTSSMELVDGSYHRMPSWGCYSLDGKNLEKTGVAPDIYVKNTIEDKINDKDPQLRRAVDEIMSRLPQVGKKD